MPQFEPAFFSSQIFWTIVSFIVLFIVLSHWVLPRIAAILQQRTHLIEEEIAQAHRKREEMEGLKREYETRLSDIDQEAKKIFDASEKRIVEQHNRMMGEWKAEMEKRKRDFLEDAEITRRQAIREIRKQSAELIITATEQLIHQKVDSFEARKALQESIVQLEKRDPAGD
ncbi:MAG: F0F1 ATP synthase subunit B [Mariprofundaceae bacterium]|nr:F0F1 ATP synthase subunit B [Mariprofundaceae bacterium]